jgi:hypothetical protein
MDDGWVRARCTYWALMLLACLREAVRIQLLGYSLAMHGSECEVAGAIPVSLNVSSRVDLEGVDFSI